MKSIKKKNWVIVSLTLVLGCMLFFYKDIRAYAYSGWGFGKSDISSIVETNGTNPIDIDSNTIIVSRNNSSTEYQFYNANGTLIKTYKKSDLDSSSFILNRVEFTLPSQGYIKVTNVGFYNGRMVDAIFKNEHMASATARISSTGGIRFVYKYQSTLENNNLYYPKLKASMQLTYRDSGNAVGAVSFLGPVSQYSDWYNRVYGYDKQPSYRHLYAVKNAQGNIESGIVWDWDNSLLVLEFVPRGSKNDPGIYIDYLIYGQTNSQSKFNLYATTNGSQDTILSVYEPGTEMMMAIPYVPLDITNLSETTNDGKTANFTMTQYLPKQDYDTYYPYNDSFKLVISEENAGLMTVNASDFELYMGEKLVDASNYTLSVDNSNSQSGNTKITVTLTSDFIKKNPDTLLEIRQKSEIINNQKVIEQRLNSDKKLEVDIDANLTYSLSPKVNGGKDASIPTATQTVEMTVKPKLNADKVGNPTIVKGTKTSDIPFESLLVDERNESYTWDDVIVTYKTPNTVCNTVGATTITVLLTSKTFGTVQELSIPVTVVDKYVVTYDANGGSGTPPSNSEFISEPITLPKADNLSKEGYVFSGWSLSQNPSDTDKIYQPGEAFGSQPEEKSSVTLYAVWQVGDEAALAWTITGIEKDKIMSLDKADLKNRLDLSIFWQTPYLNKKYKIVVKNESETVFTQNTIVSDKTDQFIMDMISIPGDKLNYGENIFQVGIYAIDSDDNSVGNPLDKVSLKVTISGSLQITSIPQQLTWTDRTSRDSKGIMDRDENNMLALSVVDSRNIPEDQKVWCVSAKAVKVDGEEIPFELVWKEDDQSDPLPLDTQIKVLSNETSTKSGYSYTKTWDETKGVVLESSDFLKVGDYSNLVSINWALYDTAQPE